MVKACCRVALGSTLLAGPLNPISSTFNHTLAILHAFCCADQDVEKFAQFVAEKMVFFYLKYFCKKFNDKIRILAVAKLKINRPK